MIRQQWLMSASLFGMHYTFSERGDGLPMHSHASTGDYHDIIVLKGSIHLSTRGASGLSYAAGQMVPAELVPEWHEVAALEPGTETLHLYVNGMPAGYEKLPATEWDTTMQSDPLENPVL